MNVVDDIRIWIVNKWPDRFQGNNLITCLPEFFHDKIMFCKGLHQICKVITDYICHF